MCVVINSNLFLIVNKQNTRHVKTLIIVDKKYKLQRVPLLLYCRDISAK